MVERKGVSLSEELHHLIRTIDGVRELAERLNESLFHDGSSPLSIASSLIMVKERLRLIDRVVRGDVDPRILWCAQNDALLPTDEGTDVVLWIRSEKEAVRRLRKELKAAKRRLRRQRDT